MARSRPGPEGGAAVDWGGLAKSSRGSDRTPVPRPRICFPALEQYGLAVPRFARHPRAYPYTMNPNTELVRPQGGVVRALFGVFVAASLLLSSVQAAQAQADLRVCLIAGVRNDAYDNSGSLTRVKAYLEKNYRVACTLVNPTADGTAFQGLEALDEADAAVLFVRRMTLPEDQLARIRKFVNSGKGVVGLRTTSHAFNEWTTFDVDVLGAKYGMHFGPATRVNVIPHVITRGGSGFATDKDIYKYSELAPDVKVIIEASNEKGSMPVAWARERAKGGRVVYVGFGFDEEFQKEAFLRIIADGVIWAAGKDPAALRR